jgi:hypothetical protein
MLPPLRMLAQILASDFPHSVPRLLNSIALLNLLHAQPGKLLGDTLKRLGIIAGSAEEECSGLAIPQALALLTSLVHSLVPRSFLGDEFRKRPVAFAFPRAEHRFDAR